MARADRHWQRCIPTRPSNHDRAVVINAYDGVIDGPNDGPIVGQEQIGDTAKAVKRFVGLHTHWLVSQVATGAHDRPVNALEQQVMQRRVRQHDTEPRVPRRNTVGQ